MDKIEMSKISRMMVSQMFADGDIVRLNNLMRRGYIVKSEIGDMINRAGGDVVELCDDEDFCNRLDDSGFRTYGYSLWRADEDAFERVIQAVLNDPEYRKYKKTFMFRDVLPETELENMEFADAVNKLWK